MSIYKKIIAISSEDLKVLLGIEEDIFITAIEIDGNNDSIKITCQSSKQKDSGMYEVYPSGTVPHQRWNKDAKEEGNKMSRLRSSIDLFDVRVKCTENCYTEEDCETQED